MIGEKIRKIRTIKGYSQDYVSSKLNISQAAYSEIENGKTNINIERLKDIAKVFEVDVNDLLSFDENQIYNNTFNEKCTDFFNVKKVITDTFDKERESYLSQIQSLKEEIAYLRKKLDEKE